MALKMAFVSGDGGVHPDAHWRAVEVNIATAARKIRVVYYGYHDRAHFESGGRPISDAVHAYELTGDEFLAMAAAPPGGPTMYDAIAAACDGYALSHADTPDPDWAPDPDWDESVQGVQVRPLVSFFRDAVPA